MLPMKALRLTIGELLAADVANLAPTTPNKIALIANSFNPADENLVVGDLVLATFTGSAPKAGAAGAQQVGIDPLTGDQIITILQPAGGYRFECTSAPGTPEVIYGFALLDDTLANLLGVEGFTDPITITDVGDFVDTGAVQIDINARPAI